MAKNLVEDVVAVVGGAVLGAAVMYLLDPDMGQRRRRSIGTSTSQAVSSTADAARSAVRGTSRSAQSSVGRWGHRARSWAEHLADSVQHGVHDLSATVQHGVHDVADRLSHRFSRQASRVSKAAGSAVGSATAQTAAAARAARQAYNQVADQVQEHSEDPQDTLRRLRSELSDRVKHAAGVQDYHPVAQFTGHTVGSAALVVLGAASMYFLDPTRGRGRRAWLGQQVYSATRRTGKRVQGLGRHMGNKMQGYTAQASHLMPQSFGSHEGEQASMPSAGSY